MIARAACSVVVAANVTRGPQKALILVSEVSGVQGWFLKMVQYHGHSCREVARFRSSSQCTFDSKDRVGSVCVSLPPKVSGSPYGEVK